MTAKTSKAFYYSILQGKRYRESTVENRTVAEESVSDKARIIFSSSFRRLQQKAQVFSLEANPSVRSRLAHSLEVAETGTRIARIICDELSSREELDEKSYTALIQFIENACLVHDIGNPPFGHFGEAAISKWFKDNWRKAFAANLGIAEKKLKENPEYGVLQNLIYDFLEFDGNPQGIRIITKLQSIDNTDFVGLNLTFTQVLSILKYTRTTQRTNGINNKKKPAYFQSESQLIDHMKGYLGIDLRSRFPLSYIVEAADDISYCLSDLEDGIEKKIIAYYDVFDYFHKKYHNISTKNCPEFISKFIHDYEAIIKHGYESSISKWNAISDPKSDNRIKSNERVFLNLKTGASEFLIKKAADI